MRLSNKTEKLIIELVRNKSKLSKYVMGLYKDKANTDKTELNGRFGELRDFGLVNVIFADNIAYEVILTHKAEDYLEKHGLMIKLFDKDILIDILRRVGQKHGIDNLLIYDIDSCGNSQIGWRQTDEYEWEIKIEAIADILLVKRVSDEIKNELYGFGFTVVDEIDDDSTPRFKRNIKLAHSSVVSIESNRINTKFNFSAFFHDFINSCKRLQANRHASKGTEDEKTVFIRDMLHTKEYKALDQTQRGQSCSDIQAGEVDLLICDSEMMPEVIIEALVLDSINTSNIKYHIDKVSKYDKNGLRRSIMLVYVYSADFKAFANRYKEHIESADFEYPFVKVKDISDNEFSEIKVLVSEFQRSGLNREMLHVLVQLT